VTPDHAAPDLFDLTGQVAVITGGGTGIGLSMATALGRAGSDVCLWGRRIEPVEQAAADLAGLGRRTLALSVDVTDEQAVVDAMARTVETFGRVDTCIEASPRHADRATSRG